MMLRQRLRSAVPPTRTAPSIVPQPVEEIGLPPSVKLRPMPTTPPHVLLIGASTGGPRALNDLIAEIGGVLQRAPVLITQHMPATFTGSLLRISPALPIVPCVRQSMASRSTPESF